MDVGSLAEHSTLTASTSTSALTFGLELESKDTAIVTLPGLEGGRDYVFRVERGVAAESDETSAAAAVAALRESFEVRFRTSETCDTSLCANVDGTCEQRGAGKVCVVAGCSGVCRCPAGLSCEFSCEEDRCQQVECGASKDCKVYCSGPVGASGCQDLDLFCGEGACQLVCEDRASCGSARVECGSAETCDVRCQGEDSCRGLQIEGTNSEPDLFCTSGCFRATVRCGGGDSCAVRCTDFVCNELSIECESVADCALFCWPSACPNSSLLCDDSARCFRECTPSSFQDPAFATCGGGRILCQDEPSLLCIDES